LTLNLAIVADDEPLAVPEVPAKKADKAAIDRRAINRRAVKYFPAIRHLIVDMHGRPLWDVARLSPNYDPQGRADGQRRQGEPRLNMFRGPSSQENADGSGPGAWHDIGTGQSGRDLISLVEYLGECSRERATLFLRDLTSRLAEVELR
jgi:hypothetical protein